MVEMEWSLSLKQHFYWFIWWFISKFLRTPWLEGFLLLAPNWCAHFFCGNL